MTDNKDSKDDTFQRVTPGIGVNTSAPLDFDYVPKENPVHVHVPQEGYDKVTLKAGLCVLGAWGILLIIGA